MKICFSFLFAFLSITSQARFYDWPMWRYDYNRSASTPEKLAEKLYLQWQVKYSARIPVWDDPLNQNLMQFDRIFEPVVADNKIFLGFNDQDKVIALDINSGKELWHYFADGPVRMPLAANKGKIYFTSDDGYLYCLNSGDGSLIWKLSLAPAANKLLGNKRLISMWPARGGIAIKDDIIYTAASIFPMMGTFIYAINAENGETVWKNEGTGSNYILQPHRSPAFADVAPQGTFTISGDKLLVAGGRSVPAAFDLKTGEQLYYKLAESGKTGGAFTCATDNVFFNHHRERMTFMYDSRSGVRLKSDAGEYPVIDGDTVFFSGRKLTANLINYSNGLDTLWESDFSATNDLIKAGDCLYAADSSGITAIKIVNNKPLKLWSIPSDKNIERLVASNGKLIAVTSDGEILVYGDNPVSEISTRNQPELQMESKTGEAKAIVDATGITSGYGLVFGTADVELLKDLVTHTSLTLVAYDGNSSRINDLREYFDGLGVKSDRLSFLLYDKSFPLLPKYFSSLTIINDLSLVNVAEKEIMNSVYESTRPFDGKIWIRAKRQDRRMVSATLASLNLHGAELGEGAGYSLITRTGALEGSADWTHNYGDIANTIKSEDQIVKAPLGILWFGGNSNMDVLPRHGHGPSEQVIDGRLVIQGINSISARDVYTGRLLWKREFENLKDDTWLVFYDETYDEENPLDPKYNQVHLPGANARGTNYIVTREYVYAIEGANCHLIDIRTGELVKTISTGDPDTQQLGYIGVYDDLLILGSNFADFPEIVVAGDKPEDKKFTDFDRTASKQLILLDRFSGEKKWSIKANHGFIHNSIIAGDGLLFCLDKLPQSLETKLRRRGEDQPQGSRLIYLDIKTGAKVYEETKNVFGTWLGYSSEHKLLLQATRPSKDMLSGEEGRRMIVYKTLTREIVWDKPITYANPPIISNDKIYTNGEGFSLLTGEPLFEKDPLTGEDIKWNFKREYGCGYVVASEHLLTFRSASAGFINLGVFEGTGSLGGFKAGCSANLIVANGVLNSPDYTRTCQCPYQNQTSLALINMPWMNYWTNSNYKWSGKNIRNLGLNLNAPGDRTSLDNILWLDFPNVGGTSPDIPVRMDTAGYYLVRKDPISVDSQNTPWISASAIGGIRSIEITLSKEEIVAERSYNVRLYFSELENKTRGERVFDVSIQGEKVLDDFDIVKEAGGNDREVIRSFYGVSAGNILRIELDPQKGNTLLSGIELIQENVSHLQAGTR